MMRRDPGGRDPGLRLLAALGAVVLAVATTALAPLTLLMALGLASALRHPGAGARIARRIAVVSPIAIVSVLIRIGSIAAAAPGSLLGLTPTREALAAGTAVALRIVTATIWMVWLGLALTPAELDAALLRVGVPAALVELLAQTRRFGSQLAATQRSALTAAQLRGGFSSARAVGNTAGLLAGILVVRALDRGDRVALAMALRGHAPAADHEPAPLRSARLAALTVALIALGAWLAVRP